MQSVSHEKVGPAMVSQAGARHGSANVEGRCRHRHRSAQKSLRDAERFMQLQRQDRNHSTVLRRGTEVDGHRKMRVWTGGRRRLSHRNLHGAEILRNGHSTLRAVAPFQTQTCQHGVRLSGQTWTERAAVETLAVEASTFVQARDLREDRHTARYGLHLEAVIEEATRSDYAQQTYRRNE